MKINRLINNNIVSVNEDGIEKIVMGKGLGFGKKSGDSVDESRVEKIFIIEKNEDIDKYLQLLKEIPVEYFIFSEEIISEADEKFGKKMNSSIHISLADHIYNSVKRNRDNITIKNVLTYDIRRYYPEHYNIGIGAIDTLNEKYNLDLNEDEASFIALHIINSYSDNTGNSEVEEITSIINAVLKIIKYEFNQDLRESSIHYDRFITHLKFFAKRVISNEKYEGAIDFDLFELVKTKYKLAYEVSLKVKKFIEETYGYEVKNDELLYLTVHIENIINKTNK